MARGVDHASASIVMTVTDRRIEMRVELEILARVLAMPFRKTHAYHTFTQHPFDADGELGFIGAAHQYLATGRLDHRCVVQLHSVVRGQTRGLVRVDGMDGQIGITSMHDLENIARALGIRIIAAVEIGHLDRLL